MLVINGAQGEGGGQILRSALGLSMATGTPFRIENIRAGRKKPGLMRQHLTAVQAATRVSCAQVEGDRMGATELSFEPGPVTGGEYCFAIGTAGSATLVLQTVLPALMLAPTPSKLTLAGGTHNPFAPPFDFLERSFAPQMKKMGVGLELELETPGFFPAGGGKFRAMISPVEKLEGFELLERGKRLGRSARAVVNQLPAHIAEREVKTLKKRLSWGADDYEAIVRDDGPGPGNVVMVELRFANVTEVFTGFGAIGKSAEKVAVEAAKQCRTYLASDAPAGEYLADQLLMPLAMAGGGAVRCTAITRHAQTQMDLLEQFCGARFEVEREGDGAAMISVECEPITRRDVDS